MSDPIPADYAPLLAEPNYGHLGTIRPDGSVQVNPMWFLRDGDTLRFTHTTTRAKYRNLMANPVMSLSVLDPANPLRYLEVRGRLVAVEPDPEAAFFALLAERYGDVTGRAPRDVADRVVLVMSIERVTTQ